MTWVYPPVVSHETATCERRPEAAAKKVEKKVSHGLDSCILVLFATERKASARAQTDKTQTDANQVQETALHGDSPKKLDGTYAD